MQMEYKIERWWRDNMNTKPYVKYCGRWAWSFVSNLN